MGLKYLGTDPRTDWIPGVPARDLTDEDLAELGDELATELAASALYEGSHTPAANPRPSRRLRAGSASTPSESAPAATQDADEATEASKGDD